MIQVLSTKILSPLQKAPFEKAGISLEEYNAINIDFSSFALDLELDNYIFTSQNAVRGFLRVFDDLPLPEKRKEALEKNCFCVGMKTSVLLKENGLKVVKTAKNSKELANFIAKNHKNESFFFICGNRRRAELPQILTDNKVRFMEVVAYRTTANTKRFEEAYNGLLFFSPSGVQSYTASNRLGESTAFCIGETTAAESSKYTNNIVIAKQQSIESVVDSVVNHYTKELQ